VLLRWCLQHGVPVIPKSTHRDRIAANARLFDFTLADADMAALDALDRTRRCQHRPRDPLVALVLQPVE
jgi:diketogulonate reductase-like aldo/keto reductase